MGPMEMTVCVCVRACVLVIRRTDGAVSSQNDLMQSVSTDYYDDFADQVYRAGKPEKVGD
jgi:hypothetical protein